MSLGKIQIKGDYPHTTVILDGIDIGKYVTSISYQQSVDGLPIVTIEYLADFGMPKEIKAVIEMHEA